MQGWADVGFHRNDSHPEIQTPNIDSLAAEGVELLRHYVHFTCTPSRSSFLSGRLPVHVQTTLANPEQVRSGCDGRQIYCRRCPGACRMRCSCSRDTVVVSI